MDPWALSTSKDQPGLRPRSGTFRPQTAPGLRLGAGFSSSQTAPSRSRGAATRRPIPEGAQLDGFAALSMKITGLVPTFPDGRQVRQAGFRLPFSTEKRSDHHDVRFPCQIIPRSEAEERRQRMAGPTAKASKVFLALSEEQIRSMELEIQVRPVLCIWLLAGRKGKCCS
jgi:hypothetical protein